VNTHGQTVAFGDAAPIEHAAPKGARSTAETNHVVVAAHGGGVSPTDRIVAGYNVALCGIWCIAILRSAHPSPWMWVMAAVHALTAPMPWIAHGARGRVAARIASFVAMAGDIYPLLAVAAAWTELGHLIPLIHPRSFDDLIFLLDGLVFGTHWHLRWIAAMPWPWLAEVMYCAYFSLYPLLILIPLALAARGLRAALRDYVFSLTLTYLVCSLIYLAIPVVGPAQFVPTPASVRHGFFFALSAGVQHIGDSLGTSFPSTHVAASTTMAIVAWRRFTRPFAVLLTFDALVIALATVYTQNHYALDVIAGFTVVAILHGFIAPALTARTNVLRVNLAAEPV